MALKTLSITAYNLTTGASQEISALVEELRFTTIAPGGYGDLTAKLRISNARLQAQQSQFALFANVAVMDGPFPVYLGRWDEPAIVLDSSEGDELQLTALGASQCTTDDPTDVSYLAQTPMAIISDQMTSSTLKRNKTLPLDTDQTNVLPNNPAGTFNLAENGKNFEDVLNEMLGMLGDYTWAVWGHQNYQPGQSAHADAAGFPSWQMNVHKRDTSSANLKYTAYLVDEESHDIRPSIEYSYSVVTIKYRDATTLAPASVTVQDAGLNSNGSQGTCAIPWRRLSKDLSTLVLSSAQAQAIANALLADYQKGGAKITVVLDAVRDANGNLIPLWQVRADSVISLPELAPLAAQLPTTQTAYTWANGGTLFYITETEYDGSGGATPKLTITANSFSDKAAFQIQRIQAIQEKYFVRERKHHSPVQASGEPLKGSFAWTVNPTSSSEVFLMGILFSPTLTATPSSVTISVSSSSNATGVTAGDLTVQGFSISWTVPSGASASTVKGTWQTVGN